MTWSEDFNKMWWSVWQVGADEGSLELHRFTTHFERCMLTEQSESIVPAKAGAKCISALVTCWTRDAMHHFLGQPQNGARERAEKNSKQHFCASFVRLTIINKSFVVFMPFFLCVKRPRLYFRFIIHVCASLESGRIWIRKEKKCPKCLGSWKTWLEAEEVTTVNGNKRRVWVYVRLKEIAIDRFDLSRHCCLWIKLLLKLFDSFQGEDAELLPSRRLFTHPFWTSKVKAVAKSSLESVSKPRLPITPIRFSCLW